MTIPVAVHIQVYVFITYLAYIIGRFGVLDSISASYYHLPKNQKPLFTLFIWALAAPTFSYSTGWYFGSGAFLCFVGAAAAYKESMTNTVHYVGAVFGIGLALIGLWREGIWFPAAITAVAFCIIRFVDAIKNKTWWVEVAAFLSIMAGLIARG